MMVSYERENLTGEKTKALNKILLLLNKSFGAIGKILERNFQILNLELTCAKTETCFKAMFLFSRKILIDIYSFFRFNF